MLRTAVTLRMRAEKVFSVIAISRQLLAESYNFDVRV